MRPTSSLAGHAEYTFKHALIRDVAYGGLSIAGRARAHAAVADWLAGLSPERPEELAELVAFHYRAALGEGVDLAWPAASAELAEVKRRARTAFLLAGETARKRFSIDSAIDFLQRALDLATDDEERATRAGGARRRSRWQLRRRQVGAGMGRRHDRSGNARGPGRAWPACR